ncbi:unnamed protein product, partial [marine sediment metagenome]
IKDLFSLKMLHLKNIGIVSIFNEALVVTNESKVYRIFLRIFM